jgi:hypothetical protein
LEVQAGGGVSRTRGGVQGTAEEVADKVERKRKTILEEELVELKTEMEDEELREVTRRSLEEMSLKSGQKKRDLQNQGKKLGWISRENWSGLGSCTK